MDNLQQQTPLFDALLSYYKTKPTTFHVPGHKNGAVFHYKGREFYQNLLRIDATEIEGLDDLHAAEGPIMEAQLLLASLYKTKKSYFLVNGTTCGNLAMVLGTCKEGDIVLVQRNCHKSILHALTLAKVRPVFLHTQVNKEWGTAEGILPVTVRKAIRMYPAAKAIIITYPSYYGVGEHIEEIISTSHEHGLQVLVDEAHGAHFIAGSPFLKSSLEYGADYVVQSAHKTLPAMTMGSFLHINKGVEEYEGIEKYLRILQSSSPSYPIMASLDLARSYVGMLTKSDLDYTKEKIVNFRKQLQSLKGIKVLEHEEGTYDILKTTVQTDGTFSGFQLQTILQEYGIYTELADPLNVLFVFPILKKDQIYPIEPTIQAIKQAVNKAKEQENGQYKLYVDEQTNHVTELELTFSEMELKQKKYIDLSTAAGRVSAETIIPYPPGIPYIMNGEKITSHHMKYLQQIISLGAKFHGSNELQQQKIQVYL